MGWFRQMRKEELVQCPTPPTCLPSLPTVLFPLPVGAVAITSPHHSMLYAVALRTEAFPLMQTIRRGSLHQVYISIMKWEVLGTASDECDKLGLDVIYAFAETVFPSPLKGPLCPFTLNP